MIPFKILNYKEKKKILYKLNSQFGIEEIDYTLLRIGKERINSFTGDLQLLNKISELWVIEGVGCYFGKEQNNEIRLSIEGSQLVKNQAHKKIIKLTKEQKEKWMHGQQLELKTGERGFVLIKYKDDFLGTGKASEEKIGNFIPKQRRLKDKG